MQISKHCHRTIDMIFRWIATNFLLGAIKLEIWKGLFFDDLMNPQYVIGRYR